jgi:addiction module HigA family antidote
METSDVLPNPHPGVLLREDFLEPLGITPYRLAKATGLTPIHISELLRGRRNVTAKTALLLGKFFDQSPQFWLNLQNRHDLLELERSEKTRLAQVVPYSKVAA